MSQLNIPSLDTGDVFPDLTFNLLGAGPVTLPEYGAGGWRILLVYRGDW